MAVMSVSEWRKKKEEKKVQGTSLPSASTQTTSGSGTGKLMSPSEWKANKKATSSLEGWAQSATSLLNETRDYFNTWRSGKDEDGAYSTLKDRRSTLLAQADNWRKQYAGEEDAVSQINSIVSALSGVGDTAQKYFDFYSQWESGDAYNVWQSKESFINAYLSDPEKATSTIDHDADWLKEAQYRAETKKVLDAEDFQDYSKYASTKTGNWWDKAWSQYSMGYGDLTYEYINNQDDIRSEISRKQSAFSADTKNGTDYKIYDHMTADEVSIYNYYYAKEGKEKADEYLYSIGGILEARANQQTVENVSKTAREHPVLSSVASVGTSLGSGFEYIEDVLNYGADKITGKDARLGTNENALMTNAVRGTVSDMVAWEIGNWDAFDFLYSTAMSGADSLASGLVFGKLGGAVLGLSAAAQGTNDALDRGMSNGQAFVNGLVSGVFEGLFETVSIGNFQKLKEVAPDSVKAIIKNLGKSMLVNASEETLTELANITYDTLINGEFANYTWEELKNGAWKDALAQVIEAGASGALMGVGMGTVGNAIGYSNGSKAAKQAFGSDPGALVGEALETDPENAFAQKMQGRLDRGKSLSGGQLNKLNNQIMEGDMNSIQAAAAQRLTELGETGDVNSIAQALAKQAAGEELSRAEKRAVQNSKYGSRVANELNTENIQSGDYASGWAESIGTHRINSQEYGRLLRAAQQVQETAETTGEQVDAEVQNEVQTEQVEPVEAPVATGKESLQVAEDGVTRQKSTGKTVTPKKIVSISGDKVMIETDSGVIAADDIEFGTEENDLLWRSAIDISGITPAGANGIIHAYRSGQPVATYLHGAAQEFRNGYYSMDSGGEYADQLTPAQQAIIYELGQKAAGENTAKAQAKAAAAKKRATTADKTETAGKVHFDRKGRTFDQKRETALKTMEQLSAALGVEFYVFESYVNEAGKRVYKDANGNEKHAPNGWYDPSDGSIHIDLNAGVGGKGTMLFTIAHELTHFIWHWSPAKFKVLANFLVKQYGEKGASVEKLVQRQIAKAEKNGRTVSYDTAFEDMVADSMETMLTDGNVVQLMADLKQQDKGLWKKICDWFKNLAKDLKAIVDAYRGVEPDSVEGKLVADMQDVIVILESLYADALADASANFQAARAEKSTTQEGGVDSKYSIREGMTEEERYEELKDKKILVISDSRAADYSWEIESLSALNERAKSKAEKIIIPVAKKLGILGKTMTAKDVDVEFIFSKNNGLMESISKQLRYGGNYVDFAKTLVNLDKVVDSAVLIEVHGDKYRGTIRENENLQAVYVLFSAFRDGKNIIPVQMEIKKSSDIGGRLYLTVALTKIEAGVLGSTPGENQTHSLLPASEYSLAEIFSKINPQDKHFLKYLPDGFLSDEQIEAKNAAVTEDAARIAGYKKEASPPRGSLLRASSGVPNASKENVTQNAEEVKKKFSLRDTVEETKDLVAVHNLSEKKLLKSLQLGGLPMPSIAILRAQDGHSEFGDISLVFGKDTIDPQAYRTNKLYSGDAWTPTYPNVEYKPNSKVLKQIEKKISELVPSEVRKFGRLALDIDNMTDTLNRYGGDVVDAFKDNDALKYAYLKESGADIQLPMIEKSISYHGSRENGAIIKVAESIPADVIQNAISSGSDEIRKLEPAVSKAVTEYVQETYGDDQFILDTFAPAEGLSFSDLDGYLVEARKYLRTGIEKTVDTRPAREMIRDMTVQYSYEEWLSNLFSGIVEKEGIRNNADYFTPSGNRRSFEALHYEHNLENVIKAMREKGEKGIGAFGGGSIFGAATTEFSSIEEMKQAGERLQKIPEEEYQKMRDAFSERFFELASSLPKNKNSFSATDDAANMLVEAVTRYSTKSGMANYIRRESEGWATYNDYVVDDLMELVRDIRNMPTGYFEAKPRRAVGFDEVATAIVPNTVSDDLRVKMEDMGIPFVEYTAGDEEARKTALNSLEGVKFSDRDSDGNELSREQQEYFKDSKVRDKQGRLLVMYHGTPNGGFTKFRSGTYFTQNPGYADVYQNPGASSISTKKDADAPMTYKVYLNIQKPFDTRNARERRIFQQEFYRKYGTGTPLADSGLPDWVDGMDLQEFIEEMEYDYDGLILDEGGVGGYGDEVKSRGLSYVVFDPAQVKNVDNKTPTSDPDIRFSERDPELEKVNRVLEKENTQLKHDVAYLKELLKLQKQLTGGTKFTKSSVEAAASQLMKYADARGDKKELAGLLNAVYEYIAGNQELTWDGVKEAAQPAVEWLQSHVRTRTERSGYAQDVLTQIRNSRIYLDEQQKQEVAYQYGSYNDFRKQAMGSVILTDTDSVSLDTQWHEWASMYPNLFDPDITSTDMPSALMDVFDSLRNMTEEDGYSYDRELFGQELLSRVYDSYWNVSTLYTVKDKAQKEINRLKFDHAGRMATLKQYHKDQTEQLKTEHREALRKVKQAERERLDRKLQETKERYQQSREKSAESRHKTEMRRKIRRTIMDLDKILNKGDKKRNVKEDMKDLVTEALRSADILFTDNYSNEDMIRGGVDTELTEQEAKYMAEAQNILAQIEGAGTAQERLEAENRLRGKLDYRMEKLKDVFLREKARLKKATVSQVLGSLADAYKSLENSEQNAVKGAFDENVYQYLTGLKEEVGGTTVRDMSLHQLEELHKAYTMVLTTVRNANKMFAANIKQTREQLGSQTINEVKQAGGERKFRSKVEKMANAFSWNNQKPVYAFERIGSSTLKTLFENTRAGEDTWAQDMTDAREFYLKQNREYKFDSWDFGKQYQFTSTSGIDFKLNLEQIMSLYAYSKREQAHDHLLKGGFVFDDATEVIVDKGRGIKQTMLLEDSTAYNVSMEILADIVGKLSEEQKTFVDRMQDYLSTTMGERGNEVSMQMYGVKLFNEKYYFPLRSAGQYMERAKEADLKKQQGQISIVNSGFTKATTPKSSNPVVLSSFMDVWADHVNDMSMYHSFVLPMEDFRRVYNYSSPSMESQAPVSVNSTIRNAYGKAATDYIDQLYRDLNGGAVSDPRDTPIKALMGNFKKAAVFASMSVVVQQPSAIGRAFAIIDPKYFIGGKVDSKRHKALWAELKKYAPVAAIKEMGYFDTGMGKSAQDFLRGKEYGTLKEKAAALFMDGDYRDEVLGKAPALADELTWCAIWEAAKRETRAKNPKMDVKSEEFLQLAGKRFTEVITKTQVYDSVLSRSANMRSKGLMTMWTAFMAEPTTTINMVEDALRKGKKGDKKYAARAMGAVMGSITLNALLSSLVYAMRDDDEDETYLEKYAQSFATEILDGINPITYYPFLKDIWSALQGFDIERSDMSLITSLAEKLTKLVQVYAKDAQNRDEGELVNAWWGVVDYATALAGVPVKNVRRDINGAVNTFKTISADLTDRDTSWGSLLDKTWDSVKNALPVVGWMPDKTAADKLYKAAVNGDTAYQKRLSSSYATQNSLDNAIRKGLRGNDPRIWEAAIAWNSNDLESYKRIAREIVAEGNFSQDNVVMAIQAEAKAMTDTQSGSGESKAKGYFTADKFAVAISQGNGTMAATIKADIIDTAMANGKTREEAEESFKSSAKSYMKDMFQDSSITQQQAVNALTSYCGYEQEKAEDLAGEWAFEKQYGFTYGDRADAYKSGAISASALKSILMDVGGKTEEEAELQIQVYDWQKEGFDIDSNQTGIVKDYNDYCKPAGIDKKTYYDTYLFYDASGEEGVAYSKTKECVVYINRLPLTSRQKTALALCWWAESTVNKYKLW